MKISPRQIALRYLDSWWLPAAMTAAVALAIFCFLYSRMISDIDRWKILVDLAVGSIILGLFFIGILSAAIWNFYKKYWVKGIINIIMLLLCLFFVNFSYTILIGELIFDPNGHGYGKDLSISDDSKISEPPTETEASLEQLRTSPKSSEESKGSD